MKKYTNITLIIISFIILMAQKTRVIAIEKIINQNFKSYYSKLKTKNKKIAWIFKTHTEQPVKKLYYNVYKKNTLKSNNNIKKITKIVHYNNKKRYKNLRKDFLKRNNNYKIKSNYYEILNNKKSNFVQLNNKKIKHSSNYKQLVNYNYTKRKKNINNLKITNKKLSQYEREQLLYKHNNNLTTNIKINQTKKIINQITEIANKSNIGKRYNSKKGKIKYRRDNTIYLLKRTHPRHEIFGLPKYYPKYPQHLIHLPFKKLNAYEESLHRPIGKMIDRMKLKNIFIDTGVCISNRLPIRNQYCKIAHSKNPALKDVARIIYKDAVIKSYEAKMNKKYCKKPKKLLYLECFKTYYKYKTHKTLNKIAWIFKPEVDDPVCRQGTPYYLIPKKIAKKFI